MRLENKSLPNAIYSKVEPAQIEEPFQSEDSEQRDHGISQSKFSIASFNDDSGKISKRFGLQILPKLPNAISKSGSTSCQSIQPVSSTQNSG